MYRPVWTGPLSCLSRTSIHYQNTRSIWSSGKYLQQSFTQGTWEETKTSWACPLCNFMNYPNRLLCMKCQTRRGVQEPNTAFQEKPTAPEINLSVCKTVKRTGESKTLKENTPTNQILQKNQNGTENSTWTCTCGSPNSTTSYSCSTCGKEPCILDDSPDLEIPLEEIETENAFTSILSPRTVQKDDELNCENRETLDLTNKNVEALECPDHAQHHKNVLKAGVAFSNEAKINGWICKCGALLFDEVYQCPNCSTKRAHGLLPKINQTGKFDNGEWICSSCRHINVAKALMCSKCPRDRVQGVPIRTTWFSANPFRKGNSESGAIRSSEKLEKKSDQRATNTDVNLPLQSTWYCFCGKANSSSTNTCQACDTAKMSAASQLGVQRSSHSNLNEEIRDNTKATLSRNSTSGQQLNVDKWECEQCGFTNSGSDERCFSCSFQRAVEPASPSGTKETTLSWFCSTCTAENDENAQKCKACGAISSTQTERRLDWKCSVCRFVNFASRHECRVCLNPKLPKANSQDAWRCHCGQANSLTSTCTACHANKSSDLPIAAKEVSWKCVCGITNSMSALFCPQCGKSSAVGSVSRENVAPKMDWRCTCRAINFARRASCFRCGTARSADSPLVEYGTQPNNKMNWYCQNCHTFNFASRANCIKCRATSKDQCAPRTEVSEISCDCGYSSPTAFEICPQCSKTRKSMNTMCTSQDTDKRGELSYGDEADWTCICGCVNFSRQLQCLKCQNLRPTGTTPTAAINPANSMDDWHCECGMQNFAQRKDCFGCMKPRTSISAGDHVTMNVTEQARTMVRVSVEQRPGDWLCPSCRGLNFTSRKFCFRCNTAKTANDQSSLKDKGSSALNFAAKRLCKCGRVNKGNQDECFACRAKLPEVEDNSINQRHSLNTRAAQNTGRPGDWLCVCGYLNYRSRASCNKCALPQSSATTHISSASSSISVHGEWTCKCGALNFSRRNDCFKCSAPMAESTWTCTCGSHHDPRMKQCLSCSKDRPNPSSHSTSSSSSESEWECRCGQKNPSSSAECCLCKITREKSIQRQDWVCKSCSFPNFASRAACKRCSLPKGDENVEVTKLGPGARDGDWSCRFCSYRNFASRTLCMACSTLRTSDIEDSDSSATSTWDCLCGNQNSDTRNECSKCMMPNPRKQMFLPGSKKSGRVFFVDGATSHIERNV